MTIRHLKIFVTVAECGKMRKAAELLYISQPSVSQAIQELENSCGARLFERLSQKLYLTEAGERLLPLARHAIEAVELADMVMQSAGNCAKIRIGASVSVGTCLLNDWIDRLEKVIPGIDTHAVIDNTSSIEMQIKNNRLDVGVVEGTVASKDFVCLPVMKDELVIVAGKQHPLYNADCIELEQLQGQTLIAREDGSMLRNQYELFLEEKQIFMDKKWHCTNTEAIKNAVEHGRGLAILSRLVIDREIKEKRLKIIPVKNVCIDRDIMLTYHKDKYLSRPLKSFLSIVTQT